jgi:hypothetical protein
MTFDVGAAAVSPIWRSAESRTATALDGKPIRQTAVMGQNQIVDIQLDETPAKR